MTEAVRGERRHFTQTETTFAWLRQGGVCPNCERKLDRDLFDGDHIVPWSLGGTTTLDNLQALCRACNLRKGNQATPAPVPQKVTTSVSSGPLRQWAIEALEVVASTTQPVLIEACPGAGKTRFAFEAAARMISTSEVNRVLVVVPSRRLIEQWIDASSGAGGGASLQLAPATWRHPQPLPTSTCGGVITYQALFAQPTWWAAFAAEPGYRTLIIFDEIHHAGTESGWGITSQEAFAQWAARILCLTAWALTDSELARQRLELLASELDRTWPDAAGSLREGMHDTLTLMRLGITGKLATTLSSTNPCESMIEIVRYTQRNVKRWQDGDMRKRWTAAGMLQAEQQFRRIIGYRDLAKLVIAIERHAILVAPKNLNRPEVAEPVTV